MSNEPLTFALARPSTRRDIALAVVSGISPDELAEEFSISSRTVRAYAAEWQGVHRKIRNLDVWERESIIQACRRGRRRVGSGSWDRRWFGSCWG
ncbi:ECF-type sigma factor [Mycobacteroides abscessus]|nr:ECF-type sigma factor [Mycobacteroides abscessus]MDM2412033.1 ECF-type sigma factor [Mycobacteroides abscessus]